MSADRDDQRFSILTSEYGRLCADIRSIESGNEKVIGFGLALVSVGAAIGIAQDVPVVFFILPIGIIGVMAYAAVSYLAIYWMAGYKRHIEDQLNEAVGARLLLWESLVAKRERDNINGRLLWIIYALIAFAVCSLSIFQLFEEFGTTVGVMYGLLVLVLANIFFFGVRQMLHAPAAAYHEAKAQAAEFKSSKVVTEPTSINEKSADAP